MQQSHIASHLGAAGVTLLPYHGWEIAAVFSSLDEEYSAARNQAAVADLSHRGIVRLAGPERTDYLHSMLSNDVKGLQPGQGNHATLLTPQGKMLGDMVNLCGAEEYRLITEPAATQPVFELLAKYGILSDVQVEDDSIRYGQLTVQGPQAAATLKRAALHGPIAELTETYHWLEADWRNQPVAVIRSALTAAGGYDLLVAADEAMALWQALCAAGATQLGFEALNVLRIEAGVPLFGPDLDHTRLPVEANLLDAISYTKGCYVGQEVIAKINALGHVNRILTGLVLDVATAPPPGAKLSHHGKDAGTVTSAVLSPKVGKVIALAYVRRKVVEANEPLTVSWGDSQAVGVIVEPPFSAAPTA